MGMKKLSMLLAAGCAIGMLTGCGVPEEEHLAALDALKKQHAAEVDKLKGDIADQEEVIDNEKAKVRKNRIELDDAGERIKGLQSKVATAEKSYAVEKAKVADLESELKSQKSLTVSAEDRANEAENSYNALDVEHQELKRRFEMFQNNFNSMSSSAPAAEAPVADDSLAELEALGGAPAEPEAPQSDSEKASSLLDGMLSL